MIFFTLFLGTGCTSPYSILEPAGPSAEKAAFLWWLMFFLLGVIALIVISVWLYAMLRKKTTQRSQEQNQQFFNRLVWGGGIILPTLSILVILSFGIPAGHKMLPLNSDREILKIDVIGQQWQWETYYPEHGIKLYNEIHIPINTPVDFHLSTKDVIHSFWVPRLGGKLDTIPGRINILRLEANEPGTYMGLCAEFCGLEHAHMKFTLYAHTQEDYDLWVEDTLNVE